MSLEAAGGEVRKNPSKSSSSQKLRAHLHAHIRRVVVVSVYDVLVCVCVYACIRGTCSRALILYSIYLRPCALFVCARELIFAVWCARVKHRALIAFKDAKWCGGVGGGDAVALVWCVCVCAVPGCVCVHLL